MKRIVLFACMLMIVLPILGTELVHNYYGDYKEVVRIVFVLRTRVHYTTMMDTDNKQISLTMSDTRLNPALFKMDFTSTLFLRDIEYETIGRDLRININTDVVYYAECFTLQEENYKIVFDVYRQKEPTTIEQARQYIIFYRTVGYHDRANALQRRINNNEFVTPVYTQTPPPPPQTRPTIPPPPPPPPTPPPPARQIDYSFVNDDPFLYIMPTISHLGFNIQNWIIEAFRIYDIFKELRRIIENAENTLRQYDAQSTIDISFLETMSIAHNSLTNAHIMINEIRLQFNNLLSSSVNIPRSDAVSYTERMINHISSILDSYRTRVVDLQAEYARRINR